MILQLSPEELISVYRLVSSNTSADPISRSVVQKIEDFLLQNLTQTETVRNLSSYEQWIEKETSKISELQDELKDISNGSLLEKKVSGVDNGFDGVQSRKVAGPGARGRRKKPK